VIRNVPDDVVAAIGAKAQRAGLSRTEYLRRTLSCERAEDAAGATVDDLAPFAETSPTWMTRRSWAKRGVTGWLIDTSALVRLSQSADAEEWASRIHCGLLRITTLTRLEVGFSARSAAELRGSAGRRRWRPRRSST
jgi:hypothetical protein